MQDLKDIPADHPGRAAIERAAAERSSLMLVGAPGFGGTMLARRIPGILPGKAAVDHAYRDARTDPPEGRPFRAPHHTIGSVAITGLARRPGEVALAHGGVLMLDDVTEFTSTVIETIRDVLRTGSSHGYACRPVVIVATALPCPCGRAGTARVCVCSPDSIRRLELRRERFAQMLHIRHTIELKLTSLADIRDSRGGEDSATVRGRVETAWSTRYGEVWS